MSVIFQLQPTRKCVGISVELHVTNFMGSEIVTSGRLWWIQ